VELVASATLYGLFSAWLLFPLFGVRRMLRTSTAVLMWLEFLAVLTWGFTMEDCARGSCSALAKAAGAAVAVDLPALATAVVALAVADAVRRQRGSSRRNRARPLA
jgi:membrane associated rhomboid family serine protease